VSVLRLAKTENSMNIAVQKLTIFEQLQCHKIPVVIWQLSTDFCSDIICSVVPFKNLDHFLICFQRNIMILKAKVKECMLKITYLQQHDVFPLFVLVRQPFETLHMMRICVVPKNSKLKLKHINNLPGTVHVGLKSRYMNVWKAHGQLVHTFTEQRICFSVN
jgi:hypothetical protein